MYFQFIGTFVFIHDRIIQEVEHMNILTQILIIFGFTFLGDSIQAFLNIPVPGSIIGLVLLFACLQFKIIKLKQVEAVGTWLKNNMAFLFVPITVGIMVHFELLQLHWVNLVIVMVLSTVITYLATAYAANWSQDHE